MGLRVRTGKPFRHLSFTLRRAARLRLRCPLPFTVVIMGRLTAMPNRLGTMPSLVKAAPKVAEGFYQSPEWRAYREAHRAWTIAKQGGVWCCRCGSTRRLILDHSVERKDGGPDFPAYEGADWHCSPCHNAKTANARARRARGEAPGGGQKSRGQ